MVLESSRDLISPITGRNSGHQNGYGSSGRCMCPRRPNVDGGKTRQMLFNQIILKQNALKIVKKNL